jgi:hypothetical protein
MKPKTPKQPRALQLADAILEKECTKTTKFHAANELRRLYELSKMLYDEMNKSYSAQSRAKSEIVGSQNILGAAVMKAREQL